MSSTARSSPSACRASCGSAATRSTSWALNSRPDHRGYLKRGLWGFRQAVDAGHDDPLHGVGNDDGAQWARKLEAAVVALQGAVLQERAAQLFHEERIALGPPGDELDRRRRDRVRSEDAPDEPDCLRRAQTAQRDPRLIAMLLERRRVARPVRELTQ